MAGYPTLENLFGGWLHQDWKPEFGTVENALAQYAASEGPATVKAALAELALLAQSGDTALPEQLELLGCYVNPPSLGLTARGFLTDVVAAGLRGAGRARPPGRKKAKKKAAARPPKKAATKAGKKKSGGKRSSAKKK